MIRRNSGDELLRQLERDVELGKPGARGRLRRERLRRGLPDHSFRSAVRLYRRVRGFSRLTEDQGDEIRAYAREAIQELANESAAQGFTFHEDPDFWRSAEIGNAVAVNGDLVDRGDATPPPGFVRTRWSRHVHHDEQEVSVHFVVDRVMDMSGWDDRSRPEVTAVVHDEVGARPPRGELAYWSSDPGSVEVYEREATCRSEDCNAGLGVGVSEQERWGPFYCDRCEEAQAEALDQDEEST